MNPPTGSAAAPLVTVVIPTRGRPATLLRAIRSVHAQTAGPLEIVVVIDGPDAATEAALAPLEGPLLRVVRLPDSGGPGRARNVGAAAGRAHWVAFLDDDDEWLPGKIERQLAAAAAATVPIPVIITGGYVQTATGRFAAPRRPMRPGEPLSEYMFCRRSPLRGETFVCTSSLLLPRRLMDEVKFPHVDPSIPFEDAEWMLRVSRRDDAAFVMVVEPLLIYYTELTSNISGNYDWRRSLEWGLRERQHWTPHAFAGFCLIAISGVPAARRDWPAFPALLREAFRHGRPTAMEVAIFLAMWAIPRGLRRRIRGLVLGRRLRAGRGASGSAADA